MEKFTDGLKGSYAAEVAILRQHTVTVNRNRETYAGALNELGHTH